MDDGFDVLEEKVRKAAELVRQLRREKDALTADLGKAKVGLQEAEKRFTVLERKQAGPAEGPALETLQSEIAGLRHEREEIRARIGHLLQILEGLE